MTGRLARRLKTPGGDPVRVTVFGSSTTEGYGASDPARTGYAAVMAARLEAAWERPVALSNRGVSGECIEEMMPRLDAVVGDAPDLVVWQSGSNDAPRGVALGRFEALMTEGIARLRETGADLVLMEPQYCTALEAEPDFPGFLEAMRRLGRSHGLPIFPRYRLMQDWSASTGLGVSGLSPDGTHMSDEGYRLLGEAVAAFVLDLPS